MEKSRPKTFQERKKERERETLYYKMKNKKESAGGEGGEKGNDCLSNNLFILIYVVM